METPLLRLGLLIAASATLLFLPLDFLIGEKHWNVFTTVNVVFAVLYVGSWKLSRSRWSFAVGLGLCLAVSTQIFLSVNDHLGPRLGLQTFFLLLAFLPFLLLPLRSWPIIVFLSLMNLAMFGWTNFGLDPSRYPTYDEGFPRVLPSLSAFVTLIILIVLIVYFQILARRREKVLVDACKTQDRLFSLIGHDLRGPIGGLKEGLAFLEENHGTMEGEELQDFVHSLKLTSENVYALLENLLLWASQKQDKPSFHPRPNDWEDLVASAFCLWQEEAKRKGVAVVLRIPPQTMVVCDAEMMTAALRNLISNAVKFSPSGTRVTVDAAVSKGRLVCTVSDQGIGMDKATLSSLFNSESRPRRIGVRGERGTGLGLLLVKEIVERHQGTIRVQSEIDHGSVVTLEFPA